MRSMPEMTARAARGRFKRPGFVPVRKGRLLPMPLRQHFERFFNADFSDLRIHEGRHAPAIGAIAFTFGSDIFFAPKTFNPNTREGLHLLAHEVTHVVQQRQGRAVNPHGHGVMVLDDRDLEGEADAVADRLVNQLWPLLNNGRALPHDRDLLNTFEPIFEVTPLAQSNGWQLKASLTDGEKVGGLTARPGPQNRLALYDIRVEGPYRGQNLASMMVARIAQEGLTAGFDRAWLMVEDRGEIPESKLIEIYGKMGFRQTKRDPETGRWEMEADLAGLSEMAETAKIQQNQLVS